MLNEGLIAGAIVAGAFLVGGLVLVAAGRRRSSRVAQDLGKNIARPAPPASHIARPMQPEEDALVDEELRNRALDRRIDMGIDVDDGILSTLTELARALESSRVMIYTDPHAYEERLRQSVRSLNQAIVNLRACVVGPSSKFVRTAEFQDSLGSRLADLKEEHRAQFDIKVDEEAVAVLSKEQLDGLLEVAREAARNALSHGHSKIVTVRLGRDGRAVTFTVQDNGRGFAPSLVSGQGKGMARMRSLALEMGGKLDVATRFGNGTKVLVTLPAPVAAG